MQEDNLGFGKMVKEVMVEPQAPRKKYNLI